ncbi:tryptophan 2,3-dioxygenase family protein [Halobacteriovorax sp. HLS]|uniref:tryptophan 2,3-dioxygenase family protein n=1 Tax=Halobacteriovorax sp. HLS TaxID=2234000 RepID=UPI000FDAD0D6|nr:tryptophan 2,3-dioxygenase family protein [Halobacteriovorax sp. HLS]
MKTHEPVYYGEYLNLNKLLDCQHPKSKDHGNEAHDETLFILVHQVYELWFKQILHELKSIVTLFSGKTVDEKDLSKVVARLERITKIQALLVDQLGVMETMTPMDFLEFRDLLVPASGFQSVQFREVEVLMGLKTNNRKAVDREYFLGRLNDEDKARIIEIEKSPSLLELTQAWLERIPFTKIEGFNFWDEYEKEIDKMLDYDEKIIHQNQASLDSRAMAMQIENLNATRETFSSLLNEQKHNDLIKLGRRSLSRTATMNALFILLYREEPILHLPYKFLTALMDIDELFTTWRYRHALMAQRMLGTKIGTGGSSGHHYLKMAAENNRVYNDLFNLSTFLLPSSKLPKLPNEVKIKLGYHFNE